MTDAPLDRYRIGAAIIATDGEAGTLTEITPPADTGEPRHLIVEQRDGGTVQIPFALVDAAHSDPDHVRLTLDREALSGMTAGMTSVPNSAPDVPAAQPAGSTSGIAAETTTTADSDRDHNRDGGLVVPLHEEVLVPSTREVDRGRVVVHKRVETVPAETTVDVAHDDVTVERVPVNRMLDAAPAPHYEGDTLIVPVVEEVLVTRKQLVLREEVRITRRRVSESVPVRDTVQREVLEIERRPAGDDELAAGAARDLHRPDGSASAPASDAPAVPSDTDAPAT